MEMEVKRAAKASAGVLRLPGKRGQAHHTVEFAAAASFGARHYLEDFYSATMMLNGMALFGVFDGHRGADVAEFAASNIRSQVEAQLEDEPGDLHRGLKGAFLQIDEHLRAEYERQQQSAGGEEKEEECLVAGSTAVVAVVDYQEQRVVVANVGDSRAILSRNGRAIDLARAHEPEDADERVRIEAAGGKILPNGYLTTCDEAATLSMSRSIGDFEFKMDEKRSLEQQLVIAIPEIMEEKLSGDEDFLVLSSDGIWMPSQDIVDFVVMQVKQGLSLPIICNRLIDKADANDNMAVLIVPLQAGVAMKA